MLFLTVFAFYPHHISVGCTESASISETNNPNGKQEIIQIESKIIALPNMIYVNISFGTSLKIIHIIVKIKRIIVMP